MLIGAGNGVQNLVAHLPVNQAFNKMTTRRRCRRRTAAPWTKRDHDKDRGFDVAGERGGNTDPSCHVEPGPQAEMGDQRRDTPVQSGSSSRSTNDDIKLPESVRLTEGMLFGSLGITTRWAA